MKNLLLAALLLTLPTTVAEAAVKTQPVTYKYEGVTLKGHLAYDDASKEKRPGVLVVHEWWGLDDYARKRAEQLAGLGYVAFALDMYGEGKTTEHPKEAGAMAGEVRKNVKTWQGRALAGLKVLQDHELTDAKRLAAIGYCFGGSTVLQLAHAGAPVQGVVSFHGSLPVPDDDQAKTAKAKIMICHGAADSFIDEDTIKKVRAAYEKAGVDYQMIYYGGAQHSFTVPDADKRGVNGLKYNAAADRRSWADMRGLFDELFGKTK